MNSFVVNPRTKAFTLVEMLVVIAIIGILAAVLLPVLNKGQKSGQRAFCENSLQQMGLAFHGFANDHSGKFPMAVSTNEGGSLEYVDAGLNAGEIFYTAFRNFLPLAGELVRPDALVCPTDTRPAAANFFVFQNTNLSYFVGVNGNPDKPGTILAGDRNLGTNSANNPTIIGIGEGSRLHWTYEMHQYRGNVLFADGHVEQWNNQGLASGANALPDDENLFLPSVVAAVNYQYAGSGGSGSSPSAGQNPQTQMSSQTWTQPAAHASAQPMASQPNSMPGYSETANQQQNKIPPLQAEPDASTVTTEASPETNPPDATAAPSPDADLAMSPFDRHVTKLLQHSFVWSYLLLLLLLLFYLIYRVSRWMSEREKGRGPGQGDGDSI
jgi:prepilin-type N-terminal cleavage/methylation domain-containing protein/prepilin-type processing-associated H-X9-DG protein